MARKLVGVTVIFLALLVSDAAALPDLIVAPLPVRGRQYTFNGERPDTRSSFRLVVFNRGSSRAGPSATRFSLVHPRRGGFPLGIMAVPGLRGFRRFIGEAFTPRIDEVAAAYRIRACADYRHRVRESNEANNCDYYDVPRRYIVANRFYRGTLSGTVPLNPPFPDAIERWQSNNVAFRFQRAAGGIFSYTLSATVAYQDGGTVNNCTYNGSGVDGNPRGFLIIGFSSETYTASGDTFMSYPIFNPCAQPEGFERGPRVSHFLATETFGLHTLPFSNTLADAIRVDSDDINYVWNLRGARR